MGLSRLKLFFVVLACISGVVCAFNLTEDCPNDCYADWDQGQCNSATGTCECLTGLYTGDDCSIAHDTTNDWDNIDCHGGRLYPPDYNYGFNRYCLCPPGWLGVDCSVCASDMGCGNRNPDSNFTQVCDNSYFITQYKNFNCSVVLDPSYGPFIGYNVPAVAASVSFPPNQTTNGIANLTFYLATTGTPILFYCNFSGCSYTLDSTGKLMIDCVATTCSITTWSQASAISGSVEDATGWMKLECWANQTCVWTQNTITNNFGAPFNLQCYPGECVNGSPDVYQSPIKDYTKTLIIVSIGVGIIFIFCFGSIGGYYLTRNHVYMDPPPFSTITLSFQNIRCTISSKDGPRTILHSVSGAMQPGSITAIMGASGAGKTTFLDILSGRKNTGEVTGEVYLNDSIRDMRSFKRLSGYVMQDDVFMGTLTVREYLKYVALLRLPASMSEEQKFARVDECLKDLNISHIRDSRIGTDTSRGISGGERKRLAIAAELVVDPSILLLDEPTSGLDSHSATTLIKTLHDLAHGAKKRTIIMSIHQPRSDIYHLFDYLMVFAFGQAAYQGRADEALQYFSTLGYECPEHFNPADFIIDTVSLPRFKEILPPASQYSINTGAKMGSVATVDEYASSFATQFRVLVHRSLVQYLRNPFLLRAQYMLHIIVGAMLGRLYWHVSNDLSHGGMQNRMGSLFFLVCLLSFGSITSIDLFFSERLLFLRERANGCYRTSAYFLAKAVSDIIPMRVIPPIILGSIVYYMIGFQHNTLKFFLFLAFLVLVSVSSTSMCFLISSIAPSIAFGNFLAILLLFFFLLFGGFLISLNSMPHWFMWVTYLSFMRYSYTGLMVNEFVGILILINPGDMGDDNPITITGTLLLDQVGIHPNMLYPALGGLCAIIAFFLFFTHVALHFVREKR